MISLFYSLHAAHPFWLFFTLPVLCVATLYTWRKKPSFSFKTGLGKQYQQLKKADGRFAVKSLYALRLALLTCIALIMIQPERLHVRRNLRVEGIPIMIALDISLSMNCFDDVNDQRTRIDVARAQAQRFIKKRTNDPIGLVFFANGAVSRCPLTLDKSILTSLCQNVQIGEIDPEGTKLSLGLLIAVRRLMESTAPEKVIILLTDGAPTPNDIAPEAVLTLLKKHNIRVYTIGAGNPQGGFIMNPMWGIQVVPAQIDTQLLERYAQETGGRYFRAERPAELASIYDTINQLERSSFESPLYEKWNDIGKWFLLPLLLLFCFELIAALYWNIVQ